MFDLNVKHNVKEFTRYLDRIQKQQVPFATAQALTKTAQDTQTGLYKQVQAVFHVTKKWWLKQQPTGIKIRPATKARLIASVYTAAFFADLQEEGGTKRPVRHNNLLVPTSNTPQSRRKAGGASIMLQSNRVFSNKRGIWRRKGGKKNTVIEMLFARTKTAQITPRFQFKATAYRIAAARFKIQFETALSKALRTAR